MSRLYAILCLALLLACGLPAHAQDDSFPAQPQDDPFKAQLATTLKENPEILLDALREIDVELLDLLQQAAIRKRQEDIRQQQVREMESPLKPSVDPARILQGPANAPVTIVEYSDFQCPYCGRLAEELDAVMTELGDRVRLVFKHNPLRSHQSAMEAAKLFEAVSMQDKRAARKLYKLLFESRERLDQLGESGLLDLAVKAGANREATRKAMQNPEIQKRIAADMAEFRSFGFQGVPVLVINGVTVRGAVPAQEILDLVHQTTESGGR